MILFIVSLVTGIIGLVTAGSLGGNEFFAAVGGVIGFSLPYAIAIQKIYVLLNSQQTQDPDDEEPEGEPDYNDIEDVDGLEK